MHYFWTAPRIGEGKLPFPCRDTNPEQSGLFFAMQTTLSRLLMVAKAFLQWQ